MKFFMPTIGQKLMLVKDWEFTLYNEYRNEKLVIIETGLKFQYGDGVKPLKIVKFPKGTVLTVDRIYIRQGKGAYDSITFRVPFCPDPKYAGKTIRFWARLEQINNIECSILTDDEVKALQQAQKITKGQKAAPVAAPPKPIQRTVACPTCDHVQPRPDGAFFACDGCGDLNAIR